MTFSISLVLICCADFLLFCYGFIGQFLNDDLQQLNAIGCSIWISRGIFNNSGAGLVLVFNCAIILLFCNKQITTKIFKNPLKIHKQLGFSILFFSVVHTNAHYVNFYMVETKLKLNLTAFDLHYKTFAGVTGHLLIILMIFIYSTSNRNIRKLNYELFAYSHFVLFVLFYFVLFIHPMVCFVLLINY